MQSRYKTGCRKCARHLVEVGRLEDKWEAKGEIDRIEY